MSREECFFHMLSVQTVGNIQGSLLSSNIAGRLSSPHKFAEPLVKLLWIFFFKTDNKTDGKGVKFASCEIKFLQRKWFYFWRLFWKVIFYVYIKCVILFHLFSLKKGKWVRHSEARFIIYD